MRFTKKSGVRKTTKRRTFSSRKKHGGTPSKGNTMSKFTAPFSNLLKKKRKKRKESIHHYASTNRTKETVALY